LTASASPSPPQSPLSPQIITEEIVSPTESLPSPRSVDDDIDGKKKKEEEEEKKYNSNSNGNIIDPILPLPPSYFLSNSGANNGGSNNFVTTNTPVNIFTTANPASAARVARSKFDFNTIFSQDEKIAKKNDLIYYCQDDSVPPTNSIQAKINNYLRLNNLPFS
jgi:hypothetical protein